MIPEFGDSGYLPPGIHTASLDEISERFGELSELRQVQMEAVRWMVDLAKQAGIRRIVLNGSFVTDVLEPQDVDCVLLPGPEYDPDSKHSLELKQGLPFISNVIVDQEEFDLYVREVFSADRFDVPKGMVEIDV